MSFCDSNTALKYRFFRLFEGPFDIQVFCPDSDDRDETMNKFAYENKVSTSKHLQTVLD